MRAAGLDGRWFIGVGNHEVWGDPKIEGTSTLCLICGTLASPVRISSTSSTSATRASVRRDGLELLLSPLFALVPAPAKAARRELCSKAAAVIKSGSSATDIGAVTAFAATKSNVMIPDYRHLPTGFSNAKECFDSSCGLTTFNPDGGRPNVSNRKLAEGFSPGSMQRLDAQS
jgi:hypothetical protein